MSMDFDVPASFYLGNHFFFNLVAYFLLALEDRGGAR
jgi:hypothetical protein